MDTKYSVTASSKRWPIHVFYDAIDLTLINSCILFRDICKSGVSCRKIAQPVVDELAGTTPKDTTGKNANAQRNPLETNEPPEKKQKTCATLKCRNRTMDWCNTCWSLVCGKCAITICSNCVD